MAPARRQQAADLEQALAACSGRLNLFQLMLLIERSADMKEEDVAFRSVASFGFGAAAVHSARRVQDGRFVIESAVYGFFGVDGILPSYFTEEAILRAESPAFGAFFDLFYNRIVRLFYQGWKKNRCYLAYKADDPAPLETCLLALGGVTPAMMAGDAASGERLARYADALGRRVHSAGALERTLRHALKADVRVVVCEGRWKALPEHQRTRLRPSAERAETSGLGISAVPGRLTYHRQSHLSVTAGPLDYATFSAMLPSGEGYALAKRIVSAMLNAPTTVTWNLLLSDASVPIPALQGKRGPPARSRAFDPGVISMKLGMTSWFHPGDARPDEAAPSCRYVASFRTSFR